ncbi:hypothetical protein BDK51DRAFT_30602 [Blyttiomyces helicus]|uniref:Uncharacterized protein n=1 Tax=Blyttiomyces helicus TaxID=388810 RepID=A0A4V1IS16_9FUNG|nr:hypothetical protein BDK51DRAFT_30602 [Blyttiomyces helicus]|eukprot:RKO91987.1 hypothetical protein BDK51DRAFT_30602 [Blyttiomyces helicus]
MQSDLNFTSGNGIEYQQTSPCPPYSPPSSSVPAIPSWDHDQLVQAFVVATTVLTSRIDHTATYTQKVAKRIIDVIQTETNQMRARIDLISKKILPESEQVSMLHITSLMNHMDSRFNALKKGFEVGQIGVEKHICDVDNMVRKTSNHILSIENDLYSLGLNIIPDIRDMLEKLSFLEDFVKVQERSVKRRFDDIDIQFANFKERIDELQETIIAVETQNSALRAKKPIDSLDAAHTSVNSVIMNVYGLPRDVIFGRITVMNARTGRMMMFKRILGSHSYLVGKNSIRRNHIGVFISNNDLEIFKEKLIANYPTLFYGRTEYCAKILE